MLKIAYSPVYRYALPEGHRFPMVKYELIPEQLLYEGTVTDDHFFHPATVDEEVILWTHEPQFWRRLKHLELTEKEVRRIGFPLTEQFIRRSVHIASGTIQCAEFALEHGIAMNVAGGTHHSFAYKTEAFCCLNDQAIAANYLLNKGLASRILIVDLDVHQGNGTASIFQGDGRVFTFSMHGARNYPHRKEESDLDIGLPDRTEDRQYLAILRDTLPRLLDRVMPDFIFYQSGVDVLASDRLGRLSLTIAGCRERDRLVLQACRDNRIPVAVSMGGGYSEQLAVIVEAHANTFRVAQDLFF